MKTGAAMSSLKESIAELLPGMRFRNARDIITLVYDTFNADRVVLASSQSMEDQVLTHLVCAVQRRPRIFTLDTGRLFPETYTTMEATMERYGFRYEFLVPDANELRNLLSEKGPDCFYRSVELRKQCCAVRKSHPLRRVLSTADVWICGLRREQAVTRDNIDPIEWDLANGLVKVNPLYDWSEKQVTEFVNRYVIPYNPLQDQGFRSIGCAPCTRAIGPGEPVRSGRWWWEAPEHKECGLHSRPQYTSVKQ